MIQNLEIKQKDGCELISSQQGIVWQACPWLFTFLGEWTFCFPYYLLLLRASQGALVVKSPPANAGDIRDVVWFGSLRGEDPLEEEMASQSSILAWNIPWTEKPGGLWAIGLQRLGHDWATEHRHTHIHTGLRLKVTREPGDFHSVEIQFIFWSGRNNNLLNVLITRDKIPSMWGDGC